MSISQYSSSNRRPTSFELLIISLVLNDSLVPSLANLGLDFRLSSALLLAISLVLGVISWAGGSMKFEAHTGVFGFLWLLLLGLSALIGLVTGVLRSNPANYLVGDLVRHTLTYWAAILAFSLGPRAADDLLKVIYRTLVQVEVIKVVLFIVVAITDERYARLGGGSAILSAIVLSALIRPDLVRKLGIRVLWWHFPVASFGLLLPLVRSLWIAALLQFVVLLSAWIRKPRFLILKPLTILLVVLGGLVGLQSITGFNLQRILSERASTVVDRANLDVDTSFVSRSVESDAVNNHLARTPASWVGGGFGTVFEVDGTERHHVHSTELSLSLRLGLFGRATWTMFGVVAIASLLRALYSQKMMLWDICVIGIFVTSTQFYGLIGVFASSFIVGYAASTLFNNRSTWAGVPG